MDMPSAFYFDLGRQGRKRPLKVVCALCNFPKITNNFVQYIAMIYPERIERFGVSWVIQFFHTLKT